MPRGHFGLVQDRKHFEQMDGEALPERARIRIAYGYGVQKGCRHYQEDILAYYTKDQKIYGLHAWRSIIRGTAYERVRKTFVVDPARELRVTEDAGEESPLFEVMIKALLMLENLEHQWQSGFTDGEQQQRAIAIDDDDVPTRGTQNPSLN